MIFGEKLIHEGAGIITGDDTGRVVAKFSHEAEAESFCESANKKAPTDNGIPQLDRHCERYNNGDIDVSQLVCSVWNEAIAL